MDLRRLALLVPLILLPVPAHADRHKIGAFAGLSTEKSAAARFSLEYHLWGSLRTTGSASSADGWNGKAGLSATKDPGTESAKGEGAKTTKRKTSVFLIAEVAEYVRGRDSGHLLDAGMVGLRGFTHLSSRVERFGHIMIGRQRPSRRNADDEDTDWSRTAALGGGVDIEITKKTTGLVPILRLQGDLVESGSTSGFHPYGRATVGLSVRFEGH